MAPLNWSPAPETKADTSHRHIMSFFRLETEHWPFFSVTRLTWMQFCPLPLAASFCCFALDVRMSQLFSWQRRNAFFWEPFLIYLDCYFWKLAFCCFLCCNVHSRHIWCYRRHFEQLWSAAVHRCEKLLTLSGWWNVKSIAGLVSHNSGYNQKLLPHRGESRRQRVHSCESSDHNSDLWKKCKKKPSKFQIKWGKGK